LKYLREYASDVPGRGKEMADFFTTLIDTGLRLSEAIGLKWAEVDGEKSIRLGFDNKGEQPRMVPLTERAAKIIKDRRASRPNSEKRVWPDMTEDRAEYFWKLVREALKLEDDKDFVIHACRHTFASRLAMQGVPLNVIKELGGWKTLDMVLRYAHLTPEVKEDAIRKMQQWRKDGTSG
jgi:integrase